MLEALNEANFSNTYPYTEKILFKKENWIIINLPLTGSISKFGEPFIATFETSMAFMEE